MTFEAMSVDAPARLPWNVPAIADAALDVLRLEPGDADAARVTAAAQSATELCDAAVDYDEVTVPFTVPGPVFDAAVTLTVELYRRKDAPFGVTDAWSVDGATIRLSSDVMRGVHSTLARYRSRWGVG